MDQPQKHVLLVAGEASGDMHAAHLVEELKRLDPSLTFSGLGGPMMRAAGVDLYKDMTKIAVVGFIEVLRHLGEIKEAFDLILHKACAVRPAAVILVDYPGFNLRLAAALKREKIRVIYYISPQVWAWKESRVHQIKKNVDKMLVLFQFERDFYTKFSMDAEFVGHPLAETVKVSCAREEFRRRHYLAPDRLTIGILPGSRQREIEYLLPPMLEAAAVLSKEFPSIQFVILQAPSISRALIERYTTLRTDLSIPIIEGQTYDGINACDLCMVASGTATLETALLQKPMVIVYKTSWPTWLMAKLFVKIRDIGLANVVAGKRIVPECIQFQATGGKIAGELKNIFTNELTIAQMKSDLRKVKDALGPGGSSRRAAEAVIKTLAGS